MQMWNTVSHIKVRTYTEGVLEEDIEESICIQMGNNVMKAGSWGKIIHQLPVCFRAY
jgi:hypothetical protein